MRVCKSGGKIGLANWTPEGFIGQLDDAAIVFSFNLPGARLRSRSVL
jgi:hypothetical protein